MELTKANELLNRFMGSPRVSQAKTAHHLSDSNFELGKLERMSINSGVVKGKVYRLSTDIVMMFGFTGKNSGKTLTISDIDASKAKMLMEAWEVFCKDKIQNHTISNDIGF